MWLSLASSIDSHSALRHPRSLYQLSRSLHLLPSGMPMLSLLLCCIFHHVLRFFLFFFFFFFFLATGLRLAMAVCFSSPFVFFIFLSLLSSHPLCRCCLSLFTPFSSTSTLFFVFSYFPQFLLYSKSALSFGLHSFL